ncbi:MAG: hypothetical protein INR62_13870, partial [Rhodospirillales bacterium]|nr:hypothetical protein [Acetobacter sp.]
MTRGATWAVMGVAAVLAPMMADAQPGSEDQPQPALARPAVDTSMFRDGEVHRRNEMHGRWSLDCDEIPRLAQRFCSLRSLALDATGRPVARITVSTD